MKRMLFLAVLVMAGLGGGYAGPVSTNSTASNRILVIDASAMPVGAGSATLTVGTLQETNGGYVGDYKIKVFPYFLKNEKGRLVINVSDEARASVDQGKEAAISGTATTIGKTGRSRRIDAIVTPIDPDHGLLKLWFMAGERKMIFTPTYHFAGKAATNLVAEATNNAAAGKR